jgi:Flp pilus assembly protein TadD
LFVLDRVRGGGVNFQHDLQAETVLAISRKHAWRWAGRPRVEAHHRTLVGRSLVRRGELRDGRRWLLRALRLAPREWQAWTNLALSFVSAGLRRRLVAAREARGAKPA